MPNGCPLDVHAKEDFPTSVLFTKLLSRKLLKFEKSFSRAPRILKHVIVRAAIVLETSGQLLLPCRSVLGSYETSTVELF